ncbi:4'-phosphopantetheinyl transferase family protein [Mucilaginibacter flavidus]|uniref:4'-phosphopantetheinyl transferase family protein n=1 Tax=Mucilaginibacter flavidus TaxID=2949309 RepID=UPI0020934FC4|nr:4'-phosphopantetheinyl transferase superfamily protein [Mucilaginibacter flavidus]MCO5946795.1 4'-phosphopantetheinyl transferase superfamily protein [Mucilaginibacter flavidus]
MISTGNDIVALSAINAARTNQHKFYSKILTESETPLYNELSLAGIPFEDFVWLLWSIKESAYKFLQRHDAGLVFTPVKFVVKELHLQPAYIIEKFDGITEEGAGFNGYPALTGIVTFGKVELHSCSLLYDKLISTVINDTDDFLNVYWGFKLVSDTAHENQSNEVRQFLIERMKCLYGEFDFRIDKNKNGCPILFKGNEETSVPVSLSHHENIIGYAFRG